MLANLSPEDRFAIQELFARYAWAIDTSDWKGYADCFTPDALLGMNDDRYSGWQEIYDYVKGLTSRDMWPGSQHYNGQILIESGDGNQCRVRSYSTILFRLRDGTSHFRVLGIYEDTCVKVDGRWLFSERLWERWDPDRVPNYRLGGRKDEPAAAAS
jgi:hypothetical protein